MRPLIRLALAAEGILLRRQLATKFMCSRTVKELMNKTFCLTKPKSNPPLIPLSFTAVESVISIYAVLEYIQSFLSNYLDMFYRVILVSYATTQLTFDLTSHAQVRVESAN